RNKMVSHVKTTPIPNITREIRRPNRSDTRPVFLTSERTSNILMPNRFLSSRIRFHPAKKVNKTHQYKMGLRKARPIPFISSIPHVSTTRYTSRHKHSVSIAHDK